MVEVDARVLIGTAITIFLALIFFGVVVLWDVALALRSVGDKIDKLEDNIDDDLTEIAHSLDGVSHGSGGTQLHLNGGGTISSGPAAGPVQQGQEPQQPVAGGQAQTPPQQAGPAGGSHVHPPTGDGSQQHRSPAEPSEGEPGAQPRPEAEPAADRDGTEADEDATDADETTAGDEPADEADSDAESADPTPEDGAADEADDPRVRRNRGRFITSPDRTAWYATPLDRDAIAAASGPSIAGELTDGSESGVDESEIIAAGPAPSDRADDPGGTAGAEVDDEAGDATGETVDRDGTEADDPAVADAAEPAETEPSEDEDETDEPASAERSVEGEADETEAESDAVTEEDPDAAAIGSDESGDDVPPESEPSESDEDSDSDPDEGSESESDSDETEVLTYDESTDVAADPSTDAAADSSSDGLEAADDAPAPTDSDDEREDGAPREDEADRRAAGESDDGAAEPDLDDRDASGEAQAGSDADESANPFHEEAPGFEFDDGSDLDEGEAISVEEAVDTMNEDAPAPSLSSHRFDVTATEDGDGAVLTFEFDAETIEISGSTKRLLQYQMRSFADRESTPDGEVTIGPQRIVIEIPESDGTAVKQWGEAAVSIIDRTLYLSDNSGE